MIFVSLLLAGMIQTGTTDPSVDPITAILTRDWAAFGGWSLFIMFCILTVISFMRGWVVPGSMYKRLEEASKLQSETLNTTANSLQKQVGTNEVVRYFFEETAPKRREVE